MELMVLLKNTLNKKRQKTVKSDEFISRNIKWHNIVPFTQLVEQLTLNRMVGGSIRSRIPRKEKTSQMKISYAYKKISEAMTLIDNINLYEVSTVTVRMLNQKKLHKAYKLLDNFRDDLIREKIINKQKQGGNK